MSRPKKRLVYYYKWILKFFQKRKSAFTSDVLKQAWKVMEFLDSGEKTSGVKYEKLHTAQMNYKWYQRNLCAGDILYLRPQQMHNPSVRMYPCSLPGASCR